MRVNAPKTDVVRKQPVLNEPVQNPALRAHAASHANPLVRARAMPIASLRRVQSLITSATGIVIVYLNMMWTVVSLSIHVRAVRAGIHVSHRVDDRGLWATRPTFQPELTFVMLSLNAYLLSLGSQNVVATDAKALPVVSPVDQPVTSAAVQKRVETERRHFQQNHPVNFVIEMVDASLQKTLRH